MKRYILTLFLSCLTLAIFSAPALRIRRSVTLDTGQKVMVTAYGDEDFDYLLSDEGNVITEDEEGIFHDTGLTLEEYLATLPPLPLNAKRRVGSVETALIKPFGVKKIPVILVAFKDKAFSVERTDDKVQAYYDNFFNGTDVSSTGNWGSVRQYFIDQSQGQFLPEFAVIGPVELDSVYSYYGKDSGNSKDVNYSRFVRESFTKAIDLVKDWTLFDSDDNGNVDMCVLVFAGLGQNYTNNYGDKNTIWPKEIPSSYTVDGITLSGCSSSSELRPTAASGGVITATQPDGIGVVIHELSHAIGLPDLYDINGKAFGLDYWSVMDYGLYTRNAKSPVGFTAYEREFMGWQQTEVVNEPRTLHLSSFWAGGKGYKLVNDANPNEYYILDNRQALGWDWGMCNNRGHGMLVMHVDYKSSSWLANRVNTDYNHQRMTIIPANGTLIGSNNYTSRDEWQTSLQGNPYPGITENHELTDESEPASLVFTGGYMSKPLYDIEESADGIVTVKVMPLGTLDAPTGLAFEDTHRNSTTAVWEPVDGAEWYNLQLWSEGELVMQEDSLGTTSLRLTDLNDDVDYTYAVQAISDSYRNSEWAESGSFRDDPTSISEMTASRELVRIYDPNGLLVGECFRDELYRYSLRHGIYIIRWGNGKTKKIML